MAAPALVTVKSFTYRDAPEEFSNKYNLDGAPGFEAGWLDLVTSFIALEKSVYSSAVHIVRAYGYADEDNPATYVRDLAPGGLTVPGTYDGTTAGDERMPGDAAATVRWDTGRVSTRGKKIYLRKYFHGVYRGADAEPDKVSTGQLAAYEAFAAALQDDELTTDVHFAGPDSQRPISHRADPYITTRTLKRRGRRPPT